MAIVFNKKLQEDLNKLDIAFLCMHDLLIEKGVYTSEEFESILHEKINNESGEEENDTRN